eukprot:946342_1
MPSFNLYLVLCVTITKCFSSNNSTHNDSVAIVLERLNPQINDNNPSDVGLDHWQHGLLMFIAFGILFPISMMLFYFGGICSMSMDKRKRIHYIGFILTFIIYGISILFELILLNGVEFDTNHGIFGMILFCLMFVSMMVFCMMRIFKYGLQMWCDFILCFVLYCWSCYEMINGLLIKTNDIKNSKYYVYG